MTFFRFLFRELFKFLHFCFSGIVEFGVGLALVILLLILLFFASKILIELYCSREKKNFERERAEKTAELRNENTELRASLEKVIKEKGKNHIETAKILSEIGRNLKSSAIWQDTERNRFHQQAEEALLEALKIYQQTPSRNSDEVACACRHIAEIKQFRKAEQLTLARAYDRKAVA